MRLSEQQSEFMWMVSDFLLYARNLFNGKQYSHMKDIYLKVAEWYRTPEQQRLKVISGASKTLRSKHLKGLAVDLLIYKAGQPIYQSPVYGVMGAYWESLGGVWGGRWKMPNGSYDVGHFEYSEENRKKWKRENFEDEDMP